MLEFGLRLDIGVFTARLGAALGREGAILEAIKTVEQALQLNPDEVVYHPEILRIRGELWLKVAQSKLAEADFREAEAQAQRMGAKAYELSAAMTLARQLAKQDRLDEARTMLAEI